MHYAEILVGRCGDGEAEALIKWHQRQLRGEDNGLVRVVVTTKAQRLLHQPAPEPLISEAGGDGDPADPERHPGKSKIAAELSVNAQQ
jgi:hypothetical protein